MNTSHSNLEKITHLQNRLDPREVLEALGISVVAQLGNNIQCHCPDPFGNHKNGDANPSFGFEINKLLYHCFVCGGGTLVDLVCLLKECNEDTAVEWLTLESNLEPATKESFRMEIEGRMAEVEAELEYFPEYPKDLLFQYAKIHPYLTDKRGLSKDVLIEMQVGFDSEHVGITIPHFFDRRLVGIQTRHLLEKDGKFLCLKCEPPVPKYKNTHPFPKKFTLYNYDNIDWSQPVIIVESPMSVLYLKTHGYHNVVATFGNFGKTQLPLLFKAKEIWLWPDNDSAGMENVKTATLILEKNVKLAIIPGIDKEKSDSADVSPENLARHFEARYSSSLLPMLGYATLEGASL